MPYTDLDNSSVFMVYKTDVHHSYASRDIIGVATSQENALKLCREQAKKEGHSLKGWNMQFLQEKNQTQGYNGPGEFVIEEVYINKLL